MWHHRAKHQPAKIETVNPVPRAPVSAGQRLRRLLFGNPLASNRMEDTLLPKVLALPVFASDAISSVAYGTQEIVLALGAAGLWMASNRATYSHSTLLISGLIVLLLAVVVTSYWQTIFGYPGGGGSYIVSKDNLGANLGLVAAAALMIDYVLTVAVSIASGMQNLVSIPSFARFDLARHLVWLCLGCVVVLTLANLRGLKQAGLLFALPTYLFVGMCYLMIALGLFGSVWGWHIHPEYVNQNFGGASRTAAREFGMVVLLRAFANGCSAMTGTEAVANGIPAFEEPKPRNAALTLAAMGVILGTLFLGISWLAVSLHVVYWEHHGETSPAVIDQISGAVFGKGGGWGVAYLITQFATAAVLVLAANTSFADFPRLASILAGDRYVPRQFTHLGDRLVFNNGICLLGTAAGLLIVLKHGNVDALIPLYAVGVFLAFTLSQAGMVRHWFKLRGEVASWQVRALVNGVGALTTALVLVDIAVEKFRAGAWMVLVLIGMMYLAFRKVHDHYASVTTELELTDEVPAELRSGDVCLVLVAGLSRAALGAMDYAMAHFKDCRAVYVAIDPPTTQRLKERWEKWGRGMPLVVLESPYRSLLVPLLDYIDGVCAEQNQRLVTVLLPELVPCSLWESFLHGRAGLRLKLALLNRRQVVVTNLRYFLEHDRPCAVDAPVEKPNSPKL